MAWTAILQAKVPEELAKTSCAYVSIYGARSDGRPGLPTLYSLSTGEDLPEDSPTVRLFRQVWEEGRGLYGTGYVGQVRDMLHALRVFAVKYGYGVEAPPETQAKAQQEAEQDAANLPEGAVW